MRRSVAQLAGVSTVAQFIGLNRQLNREHGIPFFPVTDFRIRTAGRARRTSTGASTLHHTNSKRVPSHVPTTSPIDASEIRSIPR